MGENTRLFKILLTLILITICVVPAVSAITAGFIPNVSRGTIPLTINFTDITTDSPTGWNWSFGEGNYSEDQNPEFTFTGVGTYTVILNATNGTDYDLYNLFITAYVPIVANFSENVTSGVIPFDVQFTDDSTGSPTGYTWYFGDEAYSNGWVQTNSNIGFDIVKGIALPNGSVLGFGASASETHISTDYGITSSLISPNRTDWSTIYKYDVSLLPNGRIIWTGSNSGTGHTFMSADNGVTWVLMNSSSAWGNKAGHSTLALPDGNLLLINGYNPSMSPFVGSTNIYKSTDGGNVWVLINSTPGWSTKYAQSAVVKPDGTIIVMGGTHYDFFSASYQPQYDVWKSVDGGYTWTLVNSSFSSYPSWGSALVMPDDSILYMGGYSGSLYTNITQRSTDNGTTWSIVNSSPGWAARSNAAGLITPNGTIIISGGSVSPDDIWISNPSGSNLQDPIYTYNSGIGVYPALLQAYNSATSDISSRAYITTTSALGVIFTATPMSGTSPLNVTFTDNTIGGPTAWNWSFGDGNYSNNQNPYHIFTGYGVYTVTLNASTIYEFLNYSVNISVGAVYPVSSFSTNVTYGQPPTTVAFTDTSTTSGTTTWYWNFGDGTTSSLQNPTHTYSTEGSYHVTLTISDDIGVDTSTETIIYISSSLLPFVDFSGTPLVSTTAPLTVTFTDLTYNINVLTSTWNWSFGDGSYSTIRNPTHVYSSSGQYSVRLIVTNATGGGSNYTIKYGYINIGVPIGSVVANFSATPTSGNEPLTVSFTDQSVCNPVCNNWNWDLNGDGSVDSYVQNPSYTYTYPAIYSPKLIVSNGIDSGVKIRLHAISVGTVYVPTTIPQPTASWRPGYNGTIFNMQGGSNVDMANSTYLKYWLQNFTATGNFSIYGFALGILAPIMHIFGFWIFLIIWGLYLFAVWIRSQDVTLPLIIGILTLGTFGLLFPKEALPVIIIMFVVCGAIIITKVMKD